MSNTVNETVRIEEPAQNEIDEHYGTVSISKDRVTTGAYETWQITYTVGDITLDDGAKIKIATNQTSDWGRPQFDNPTAENYATVETDGDATVEGRFDRYYQQPRPWNDNIIVDIYDGYLESGETVTITIGDTTEGSMGHQIQSFPETAFEFRVYIDMLGTGDFVLLDELDYEIVAGKPTRLQAIAPSTADLGENVNIVVRALDYWYNTAAAFDGTLVITDGDETEKLTFEATESVSHIPISFTEEGVHRITVRDTERGWTATSNPIVVGSDAEYDIHWGDIHGQSGKTVGTGSIDEYFQFARDEGLLDFVSHAANDFQVTEEYWTEIQDAVKRYHDPGEFVTLLCNEWSSTTVNGGDNNVYYLNDDEPLLKSTGWQAADGFTKHEGTYCIEEMYAAYEGRDDVLIVPHQGGRPARLQTPDDLDTRLSPLVEICSIWGVFEWFGQEALDRGYEVGFIAGSDDHTGRLGAARPTNHFDVDEKASLQAADFNIKGGIMAASISDLSREALWEAMQERRCYGTTGERILVDVSVNGATMGATIDLDRGSDATFDISVNGTAPIKRIDLFDGSEKLTTKDLTDESDKLELEWSGARSGNRHKVQNASGGLTLDTGRIVDAVDFGFDHPEQGITQITDTTIEWNSTISGNYQGVTLDLDAPETAKLGFHTPFLDTSVTLGELDDETIVDAGHLDKQLAVRHVGEPTALDIETSFDLADAATGDHAYYIRVVQKDGGMAWSSPTFVSVG
jgi:hypothetical protein